MRCGAIEVKELHSLLHFVVAIEKGAFRSPWTTVGQLNLYSSMNILYVYVSI